MNLSKTKIGVFFLTLVILAWFLYPRTLFLGTIYEGTALLKKSEANYKEYLAKNPWSKFAVLRLVNVYEKMGKPVDALQLLSHLYEHRKTDWNLANIYLDHLENSNDEQALYKARVAIAHNFITVPHFPKEKIEQLLYDSFLYAQWHQKTDDMITLLNELAKVSRKPQEYYQELDTLDWGFQNTRKILGRLTQTLKAHPRDTDTRRELASVYLVNKQFDRAFDLINEGLQLDPFQIGLLKMRFPLDEKIKNYEAAIIDIQKILNQKNIDPEDRLELTRKQASFYAKKGDLNASITLYQKLIAQNKKDQESWIDFISTLGDFKKIDEAINTLQNYLSLFPDDEEQQQNLAKYYLYDKKDVTQLSLYGDYVSQTRNLEFALDVGYLLLEQKITGKALQWSEKIVLSFPGEFKAADLMMDVRIRQKEYDQALKVGLSFLKKNPLHYHATLRVAVIYSLLFDTLASQNYYTKLLSLKPKGYSPKGVSPNDLETLILVSKALFFLGEPKKSMITTQRALAMDPNSPQAWFWYSENKLALGEKSKAREGAQRVRALIGLSKKPSIELTRLDLKSEGKVAFGPILIEKYRTAKKRAPKSLELREDLIELLLLHKKFHEAEKEIALLETQFPMEEETLTSLKVQLAFAQKNWDKAISILETPVKNQPNNRAFRNHLAEAYIRLGKWKKGIAEYETILKTNENTPQMSDPLRELHKKHDSRVTTSYQFTDLGADEAMEGGFQYTTFLTEPLEFEGEFWMGTYKSPENSFNGEAEYGKLSFLYHLQDWRVGGGIGFGFSDKRKTASPLAMTIFQPHDDLKISFQYQYRALRVDLPQAVPAGALEDTAKLHWSTHFAKRFGFAGKYEFNRNTLPNGAFSYEQTVEPLLTYTLLRKPEIAVGYQYTFSRTFDHKGFLAEVPLLPKVSAHYLTGQIAHHFTNRFYAEGGFFIGEDTVRHLHFMDGDLWGLRGLIRWGIVSWLDFEGNYSYGRESLTGVAGQSHQISVGLSGHWY